MKIWTILENTVCRPDVIAEHGLSLYIEADNSTILFDAGQSGAFAQNAHTMGVDLKKVNLAVLSHGHYDHGGGMPIFLQLNSQAPVYASTGSVGEFYHGTEKYIGLPENLKSSGRLYLVDGSRELAPGIRLYGSAGRTCPYGSSSYGLNKKIDGEFIPDDFLHEQYLMIEEHGKKILYSGCSHRGILNIMSWFQPDVLIGGFHFKKLDPVHDRSQLESAARELLKWDTRYYTCHCTGTEQYRCMKEIMGDRLHYLSCGSVLEL